MLDFDATYAHTGLRPVASSVTGPRNELEHGATASFEGWAGLANPTNPMLVVGVLLAATAGLIGFSTSARVGPARVTAGVGKS
jgi:hypothetical protein